jgi:hypothetical protein
MKKFIFYKMTFGFNECFVNGDVFQMVYWFILCDENLLMHTVVSVINMSFEWVQYSILLVEVDYHSNDTQNT